MATSGTTGQFNLTADEAIDMALRQCGFEPSKKTSDISLYAVTSLELILKALPNDGYDRWLQTTALLGVYPNQQRYQLPAGAMEVIQIIRRTSPWPLSGGTPFTTAGGTAANAFDDSLTTLCTQTSPNGAIGYDFGTDVTQTVSYFGINSATSTTYTLIAEWSSDGVTYTPVHTALPKVYADAEWSYFTITRPVAAQYFRIREAGGATLNVRSVYLGYNPSDIQMGRINRDNRIALPNKYDDSTTPLQYYVSTESSGTFIDVWPMPSDPFKQFLVMYHSQPQDIGAVINTIDIPPRWQKSIISKLAYELAKYLPGLDKDVIGRLRMDATDEVTKASAMDYDRSPSRFTFNLGRYFK